MIASDHQLHNIGDSGVGTGLNEKECLNWLMMSAIGTEEALAHVPSDMIIGM